MVAKNKHVSVNQLELDLSPMVVPAQRQSDHDMDQAPLLSDVVDPALDRDDPFLGLGGLPHEITDDQAIAMAAAGLGGGAVAKQAAHALARHRKPLGEGGTTALTEEQRVAAAAMVRQRGIADASRSARKAAKGDPILEAALRRARSERYRDAE